MSTIKCLIFNAYRRSFIDYLESHIDKDPEEIPGSFSTKFIRQSIPFLAKYLTDWKGFDVNKFCRPNWRIKQNNRTPDQERCCVAYNKYRDVWNLYSKHVPRHDFKN